MDTSIAHFSNFDNLFQTLKIQTNSTSPQASILGDEESRRN
jgi:hypothetical protein